MLTERIEMLKQEVQRRTNSYMMDADCTAIIDSQLNGYVKAIATYCRQNQLNYYFDSIEAYCPISRNAIDFFCLWDGLKEELIEHSLSIQGKARLAVINQIACRLQQTMTKYEIDIYLSGFAIQTPEGENVADSKRVYVSSILKDVDGIILMNIAKDLNLISVDVLQTTIEEKLSVEFIQQQIEKCRAKMNAGDYDGAITNARTLIEEVLLQIEAKQTGQRQKYDGNLASLYKRVAKQMNMYPDDGATGNSFHEILRGFTSIVNGFSSISNGIADRHATAKHPSKHHAKMAVNSAMIVAEFLIESFCKQSSKIQKFSPENAEFFGVNFLL